MEFLLASNANSTEVAKRAGRAGTGTGPAAHPTASASDLDEWSGGDRHESIDERSDVVARLGNGRGAVLWVQRTVTGLCKLHLRDTTQFTVTDLKVNKITKLIDSGLATLVISGEGTTGYSFNHTGSVEFLGDGSAIVTVNGHTWTVDLY